LTKTETVKWSPTIGHIVQCGKYSAVCSAQCAVCSVQCSVATKQPPGSEWRLTIPQGCPIPAYQCSYCCPATTALHLPYSSCPTAAALQQLPYSICPTASALQLPYSICPTTAALLLPYYSCPTTALLLPPCGLPYQGSGRAGPSRLRARLLKRAPRPAWAEPSRTLGVREAGQTLLYLCPMFIHGIVPI
jgi:hypothetical protein